MASYDGWIYDLVCEVDGSIYTGSTKALRARMACHKNDAKSKDTPLYRAIRQHGWEKFRVDVVKRGSWASRSALIAEEDAHQAALRAAGKTVLNKQKNQHDKKSPESRAAISKAKLGVATKCGHCAVHNGSWQFIWRSGGKNLCWSYSIRRYGYDEAKKMAETRRKQIYPHWKPAEEKKADSESEEESESESESEESEQADRQGVRRGVRR